MNRIARWSMLVFLLCALATPLARSASAQEDAQAQLDATAQAMLALNSFHFKLETVTGKTVFQDAFELKTVEGDVVRPANFQASVAVNLAILDVTLEAVGVDGTIWVKNPIGGDSFIQVTGEGSDFELPPMEFLNPDSLVQRALTYLENPQIEGTEEIDGQQMTVMTGTFDPSQVISTGTPTAEETMILSAASQPLDVKLWIDDQDRLVRIEFFGPLFAFEEDSGRLVRRITFSEFDSAVTIEPPSQSS